LVGNTAFTDRKSVGDEFHRPTQSVTVSPVGKGLSRPTLLCRPTVRQQLQAFPTNFFFTDRRMFTDRHCFTDRYAVGESFADQLTHCLVTQMVPSNIVSFADQHLGILDI
jgi:hypothetical protein